MNTTSSILRTTLAALAFFALPACTSESDPGTQDPPKDEITGADVFTCADDDLASFNAFGGPGYNASQGGLLQPPQDRYIASTTLISPKPDEASQARFFELMAPIFQLLATHDGLIGFQVASSDACGYDRTMSVWRDEEAMMAFVMSDAHVAAMGEAATISTAAVVTHWEIGPDQVPFSWDLAREKAGAEVVSFGTPPAE